MAADESPKPPVRRPDVQESCELWKEVVAIGAVVIAIIAVAVVLGGRDGEQRRAYQRLIERQRIQVVVCRERGGMPKFDAENYVVGCDR